MEAVDVARIRTQVRLAQLALAGIAAEEELFGGEKSSSVVWAPILQANADLGNAFEHLTDALDKLNAGKPTREPRERG